MINTRYVDENSLLQSLSHGVGWTQLFALDSLKIGLPTPNFSAVQIT